MRTIWIMPGRFGLVIGQASSGLETGADFKAAFKNTLTWLVQHVNGWAERRRQRLDLAMLTDDELKDIGLERSDALRESQKPFWQV